MDLKKLWNEQWRQRPECAAAVAALAYGMLVHLFALTNILHNHDNIASQPGGYGLGVDMGRWFLEILGRFFDKAGLNYNLPAVNGMLYIATLALAAALLVSVLKLRSRVSAALIGGLFVAFPTVTATMIYRYTTIFYGISAVLAVLAVLVPGKFRGSIPAAAVLVALSVVLLGIGSLVEGMDIDEVIARLEGTTCGMKATSCPDQLARALKAAKAQL